jgi:hypothetical protein
MLHVSTGSGNVLTLQHTNAKWHINPIVYGTSNLGFYWSDMNSPYAQVDGSSGQWMHLSDRNMKENITLLGAVTEKIKQLGVYTYSFKNDPGQKKNIGVIAQEAEPLFPEMVYFNEGQYGVSYGQLAAIGIKAIHPRSRLAFFE